MTRPFMLVPTTLLLGGFLGFLVFSAQNPPFEKLTSEEMYRRIIEERDYAIKEAVTDGIFRCCINPPCTMCYMEANEWNNGEGGTCACDDLIAQGIKPCPQCVRGLCSEGACEVGNN